MSYPTAEVYGPVTASADCKNCHKDLHGQGQTAYQVVVRHAEGYNAYSLFLCTGCLGEDVDSERSGLIGIVEEVEKALKIGLDQLANGETVSGDEVIAGLMKRTADYKDPNFSRPSSGEWTEESFEVLQDVLEGPTTIFLNDMRQEDDPVPPQDTTSLCVGCDEPLKVENDAFLCPTCAVENNVPNCETCKSAYHETGDPACPFGDLTT